MKLCKDCKHFTIYPYSVPMCGHPDAPRSLVDGGLQKSCHMARGMDLCCPRTEPCGPDANLFEARDPPGRIVPVPVLVNASSGEDTTTPWSTPWWRRMFGG